MFPHTCFPCVRSEQPKQKKVTRMPGRQPGLRTQDEHASQTSTPKLRQAQPERVRARMASTGSARTGGVAHTLRQAQPHR